MNPKCPYCQSTKGFDRQKAQPILREGESKYFDPVMDLVFCSNCGAVITALIPYGLQFDMRNYFPDVQKPKDQD